jgi:Bacteriocin-protection, YdeI or OmpD-Associated/Domain of unknown function (DUF1905)
MRPRIDSHALEVARVKFRAKIETNGKTATGIPVPDQVVASLGSGKRPAVRVTVGRHSYRTTVATMGGRYLVPLSAEHRQAAGVAGGDLVEVEIEPDAEVREIALPADLEAALQGDERARTFFDGLSFTHRKEWVRWLEEAKKPETRTARLEKTIAGLREGRRTH